MVDVVARNNEVVLYERLNSHLSREVEHLRGLLTESNSRFDVLKEQFDTYLGLVKRIEMGAEVPDSIGGYESPSKKARRLSIVSKQRINDESEGVNDGAGNK